MKWIKLERSNDYGRPFLQFPGASSTRPPSFDAASRTAKS